MGVRFEKGRLDGLVICHPERYADSRGYFMELYHAERYAAGGVDAAFVQDNRSFSCAGTVRGLHYQVPRMQAKLVMALRGTVVSVAVDIRRGSPTFGQWQAVELSADAGTQYFVPEGFAHGFCVLSDEAEVLYKCSALYARDDERGLLWDDPGIGIEWPVSRDKAVLSDKDLRHPRLSEMPPESLPVYMG